MEICPSSGVLSPPPLQIVKRDRTNLISRYSPRRSLSTETEESVPEGVSLDRPLTVVKRRENKSSRQYSSEDSEDSFVDVSSRVSTPSSGMFVLVSLFFSIDNGNSCNSISEFGPAETRQHTVSSKILQLSLQPYSYAKITPETPVVLEWASLVFQSDLPAL